LGQTLEVGLSAETGTNMHAVYDRFFDVIDIQKLVKIPINYEEVIKLSRVYQFMHKTAMELIPLESREFKAYKTLVETFALLEAQHWITLNNKYKGNYSKVYKYFMPREREGYVEAPIVMLFGTLDRLNNHEQDGVELKEIYDYKTGNIPKSIRDGIQKPGDEYSWKIPSEKTFEIHYYLVLELLRRGYRLHPDIVEYLIDPKFFVEDSVMPKVKNYFFDEAGEVYDYKKDYRLGFIYLNADIPYVPKKIPIKRSLTAVFSWINKLRTLVHQNAVFPKEPNFWKCKNCSHVNKCLNEEETKLIFGDIPFEGSSK